MAEKRKLTKAGYKKLEEELRFLIDVRRPEIKQQLAEARAEGDLSENADYDAARALQAEVEGRILQIEEILKNAEMISESGTKKVAIGSIVTFKNLSTGESETLTIVDTIESNIFEGKISHACPLGEALIGKAVGDKAEVKVANPYIVEIVNIAALA
jgi:transcription elongation factor GreA